jgi:signal transduction histidine kinase
MTVAIVSSLVLTAAGLAVRRESRRALLLGARLVLLAVASLTAGAEALPTASLLLALVLDAAFLGEARSSGIFAGCAIVVALVLPLLGLPTAWQAETGRLHLRDILSILMYAAATGSLALIARFATRAAQRAVERSAQLAATTDSLIDVASGYRQYIRHAEEESMRQERNRIVGEIHDSIGYTLTTVLMLTEMLQDKLAHAGAGREMQEVVTDIHDTAKKGLTDVRISLRILKVKAREEENDLAIIQKLAHTFQSVTKIAVTFVPGNAPIDFPPRARDTIFRLIQECLVNSFRHGRASEIRIYLFLDETRFHISVTDNGTGSDGVKEGLGLAGIRENVAALGGTVALSGGQNTGFGVSVTLPWLGEAAHGAD